MHPSREEDAEMPGDEDKMEKEQKRWMAKMPKRTSTRHGEREGHSPTETEKKHKILHATNFHQFSIPFHSVRLKMEFILSPQSHNASNKMVKRMTHYVHIIYMACMQQSFAVRMRLPSPRSHHG